MQSNEFALYWRHISHSIGRLLHCLEGMSVNDLNWTPAPRTNGLYVLATHTLASTAESILVTLCGQLIMRQ